MVLQDNSQPPLSSGQDDLYSPDTETSRDGEETFSMVELTHRAPKPQFKLGDPCWVACFHENDTFDCYEPMTVVGYEQYPDEIRYMVGTYNEDDGSVSTFFDTVPSNEIFRERPEASPNAHPASKRLTHLTLVK